MSDTDIEIDLTGLTLSLRLADLAGPARYTKYAVKGYTPCHECMATLHEAHGAGPRSLQSRVMRKIAILAGHVCNRARPQDCRHDMPLCYGHAELWKQRDLAAMEAQATK